jgi:hypothetical protein
MAKTIMDEGEKIDNLRVETVAALNLCKKHENSLTEAGCQAGVIHFKSGRPNAMFINEPISGGGRKHVYIGVDPDKQEEARARVARWNARDLLRRSMSSLEVDLDDLNHLVGSALADAKAVNDMAVKIFREHLEGYTYSE